MKRKILADGQTIVDSSRIPGMVVSDFLRFACEKSPVFNGEQSPFSARMADGDPRVTVVVGSNASGKSLMHSIIQQFALAHAIEPISLSIRERTGSNEPPGSMRRMFMYGHEHLQSTGETSLRTTNKAFETLENRTAPAMVLLDEPEIGLSDGYAHAFGEMIGRLSSTPPAIGCGVMVISHSRSLIRGITAGLGDAPGYVITGEGPSTLPEWLNTTEIKSIEELQDLSRISSERRKAAHTLL